MLRSVSVAALLSACGYGATPVVAEVETTTLTAEVWSARVRGVLDPGASSREDGMVLSARWEPLTGDARSVELAIDFNRAALPDRPLSVSQPGVLVLGEDLSGTVRERAADGKLLRAAGASELLLRVSELAEEGARHLASGSFEMDLAAGGSYARIVGVFETEPSPGEAPPLPGDADRTGGDSAEYVPSPDGGCSCAGEEEPPPDEPPPPEEEEPESSGCACTGDDGGEEEVPPPDEEPAASDGCSCAGDDSTEETPPPEEESQSSGCDCSGDDTGPTESGDTDTTTEGGDADSGAAGCDCEGGTPDDDGAALRAAAPLKKKPGARCRKKPIQLGFELSPIAFAWLISLRRRALKRDGRR